MKAPPGLVEIGPAAHSALKTGPAPEAVSHPIWPQTERAKTSSRPQTVVQERPGRPGRPGAAGQGVQGSSAAPSLGSAKGRKVSTPRPQRASSGGRTAEPVSAPEQTLWRLGLPAPLTVAPPPADPKLRAKLDRGARAE